MMLRCVFMGSPQFALPALRALIEHHDVALVVTQPDKPAGRGRRIMSPPVKRLAQEAGIPVVQPPSARRPELHDALCQAAADVGIVVAYGQILPAAVLDVFPRGFFNVHASLLPAFRGAAPIQWAIIHGESETGITIMQLDEGMDTGPIVLLRRLEILPDDTAGSLAARLAPVGAETLLEALAHVEAGSARPVAQDDSAATYAPRLKPEDAVIDWKRSATEVVNRIRGTDPWPGAATSLRGVRVKLFGAAVAPGFGNPGNVLRIDDRGLWVACGGGACVVAQLQMPGTKRLAARAFAAGRDLHPGMTLG